MVTYSVNCWYVRLLLTVALFISELPSACGQDSMIVVRVTFTKGGGNTTYHFSPEGRLIRSLQTGGPVWRKDTVVRKYYRPSPDFALEVANLRQSNGAEHLLLERTLRKGGAMLDVRVSSYDPVLEVTGFHAAYRLDDQQRIIEARITGDPPGNPSRKDSTTTYRYAYAAAGRCVVTEDGTHRVVLEVIPRKQRTDVRMMERRDKGHGYTFGRDGLLRSQTFREGGLGRQTEYHRGRKGVGVAGISFSLSVGGGPGPQTLWRSVSVTDADLPEVVKRRVVSALLESLALANTPYRRYFPVGYSPAEGDRN